MTTNVDTSTTDRDVEVYPVPNRGTRKGRPWRWRYRIVQTGRVKSFASPEQATSYLRTHFPELTVGLSAVPHF
jgi:hypothetical protein